MKNLKRCLPFAFALLLALTVSIPALASTEDTGFTDVDASAWYAEAVAYCREHGLMNGTSSTTFEPESSLTRAMLVTVLWRQAGSPTGNEPLQFSDVLDGQWYTEGIRWAASERLVNGYGDGLFGTNDPITQEQMALIFQWYTSEPVTKNIPGFDGSSRPATRAQTAAALMNLARQTAAVPDTTPDSSGAKVLVAYFSRYGNTDYDSNVDATTSASVVVENGQRQGTTELIARMIAEQTGGNLHLIETAEPYSTDFNEVVDQNHQEIADSARPALASSMDVSGYDVIFVGYPVWASTVPTPVLSFLEGLDLSGKTVIPFCTHDGYGAGRSYSAISQASSGAAVEQGIAIDSSNAASSESTVANWLNGLDLPSAGTADTPQPPQPYHDCLSHRQGHI